MGSAKSTLERIGRYAWKGSLPGRAMESARQVAGAVRSMATKRVGKPTGKRSAKRSTRSAISKGR